MYILFSKMYNDEKRPSKEGQDMEEYTATEARQHFSECIARVLDGDTVKIVNRTNKKKAVVIITEEEYNRLKNEYSAKSTQAKMIRIDKEYKFISQQLRDITEMLQKSTSRNNRK